MSIVPNQAKSEVSPILKDDCLKVLEKVKIDLLRNSRIVVTGANGFLGRFLIYITYFANRYFNTNCKVCAVSLNEPNRYLRPVLSDTNIEFIKADLTLPFQLDRKMDYIFHAACYSQPRLYLQQKLKAIDLNVFTVRQLLEMTKRNSARFLFFSSVDVYGDIPKDLGSVPETYNGNLNPISPRAAYGEAKRLGETICSIFKNDYQVDSRIVRIAHTFGPGIGIDDQRVLGDFIRMALTEKKIQMLDEGHSVKTFGYVSDVMQMILNVMLEGEDFVYNVGGVDLVTIRQLADEVAKWAGNVPVIVPEAKSTLELVGSDAKYIGLDISKYMKEFGLPSFTNFSDGIRRTVEWNKQEFGERD